MASTTTKLSNIINPEVMSDMIEAKIEAQCKITPYAHVNTDLQGTAGDTITVPSWNYIGDAEDFDVEKASDTNAEVETTNLTAGSTTFTIKCAMKAVSILQTAINSGLGNPIGQATLQLAKSIVNKVDNDLIDVPNCQYCLKIDARHYYQSVNHDILKQKYRKMFKDNDLLWILDEIIDSINTAEDEDLVSIYLLDEDIDPNTGIPIGNYLSQYSGNYYFSDFDHWMKEVKHVKYYFRYMDDIVILARTKEELHQLLKEINEYFHNNMKLEIKKNYQVFPTYVRGIDYLGYRVFVSYVLLRKQTCKDMKKKMVKIRKKVESGNMMNYSEWCSINSYKGWTDYGNCFRLTQKYVEPLIPYATKYYELNVKKGGKVA